MAVPLTLSLAYTYTKNTIVIDRLWAAEKLVAPDTTLGGVLTTLQSTNSPSILNVVMVGTVDETLNLGDVNVSPYTSGYLLLHNLDIAATPTTNKYILVSDLNITAAVAPIKLKGGTTSADIVPVVTQPDFAFMRWNGAAIHAKAFNGAQLLEYVLLAD